MACRGYAAFVLWYLGYPDQALQRSHEALTLAQDLSYPYSLAYVRFVAARLHQFRQEERATQKQAEALISLSAKQGFALFMTTGTILRGWTLVRQGRAEEGISQICQGMTAFSVTGAAYTRANFLAFLAEAYGRTGQWKESLSVLDEALLLVDQTGERYYEAELYRLKGELTLQQESQNAKVKTQKSKVLNPHSQLLNPNSQHEAEACFLKAIEIAQKQQAKSLELRATMSLVRLRQKQDQDHATRNTHHVLYPTHHKTRTKLTEAHRMLSEIYNWFTEGFDTKDLQEAKVLIEELESKDRQHENTRVQ